MVKTGRPALPVEEHSFGGQLREARKAAGYDSAQAFADAIMVERPTVNRWESNKVYPPAITIILINQMLGTDFPVLRKTKASNKSEERRSAKSRQSKKAAKTSIQKPAPRQQHSPSAMATGESLTPDELEKTERLKQKHKGTIRKYKAQKKSGGKK